MSFVSKFRKTVAGFMAGTMFVLSVQIPVAQAAMVSTETLIQQSQANYDRARITEFLNQEDARQAFQALGVNSSDIERRVSQMTPEELAEFNAKLDRLPAGGASAAGVVIFILLLLIVLDLLGATDIFPAIRPIKIN